MRDRSMWLAIAVGLLILPLAWLAGENKTVAATLGAIALGLLIWAAIHGARQAWLDKHPRSMR